MKIDDILNSIAIEEAPDINSMIYKWRTQLVERREAARRRNILILATSLPVLFAGIYLYFSSRINLEATKFMKVDFLNNIIEKAVISMASISYSQTSIIWITAISIAIAASSMIWFYLSAPGREKRAFIRI